MPNAPAPHSSRGRRFSAAPVAELAGRAFRLHSMPAMATNQTSTDRSTCTTSATRKKSPAGSQALMPGVRASTSNTENRPDPISAANASHSQARARRRWPVATPGRV